MNKEIDNIDKQHADLLKAINNGELNIGQVDWISFLSTYINTFRSSNFPISTIAWTWALCGEIDEPTKRMDLLGIWQDAAHKCFSAKEERDEFIANCDCLVRINSRLRWLYIHESAQLPHTYDGVWGGKGLNELAMIWADNHVTGDDMVALASEIHRSSMEGVRPPLIEQVLLSSRNYNHLAFDNVYDFSRNLFLAECFRKFLIDGKANSDGPMTFGDFKRKIRNACFDSYIRLRIEQIKKEKEDDNWLLVDPDDKDYYPMLYEAESIVVNREMQFEAFKGSQAYHDRWFNGHPEVLQMMKYFMDYLDWKIKQDRNKNMQASSHTNIINGDYIAGNKVMGDVIEKVEDGGIGKQVVYGSPEEKSAKPSGNEQQRPTATQMCNEELFKYIHYDIIDEDERVHIHKAVCNIVRLPKVQQICDALEELKKNKKILSSIDPKAMLAELRRLGMSADLPGFSDQNFYSYYKK